LNRNQLLGKINEMRKKVEGRLAYFEKRDNDEYSSADSNLKTVFLATAVFSARAFRITIPKVAAQNLELRDGDLLEIQAKKYDALVEAPPCFGLFNCSSKCKHLCPHAEDCKGQKN